MKLDPRSNAVRRCPSAYDVTTSSTQYDAQVNLLRKLANNLHPVQRSRGGRL